MDDDDLSTLQTTREEVDLAQHHDYRDGRSDTETTLYVLDEELDGGFDFGDCVNVVRLKKGDEGLEVAIANTKTKVTLPGRVGSQSHILGFEDKVNRVFHRLPSEKSTFDSFTDGRSGAYLFRPTAWPTNFASRSSISFVLVSKSDVLEHAFVRSPDADVLIRCVKDEGAGFRLGLNSNYVQIQIVVRKLEKDNEVVFRLPLNSASSLPELYGYDGITLLKRDSELLEGDYPIAGRFTPAPYGAILRGETSQVAFITTSSVGVARESSNSILDVMIHRTASKDDEKGLGQALSGETWSEVNFWIGYDDSITSVKDFGIFQKAAEVANHPIGVYIPSSPTTASVRRPKTLQFSERLAFDPSLEIISAFFHPKPTLRIRNTNPLESIDLDPNSMSHLYLSRVAFNGNAMSVGSPNLLSNSMVKNLKGTRIRFNIRSSFGQSYHPIELTEAEFAESGPVALWNIRNYDLLRDTQVRPNEIASFQELEKKPTGSVFRKAPRTKTPVPAFNPFDSDDIQRAISERDDHGVIRRRMSSLFSFIYILAMPFGGVWLLLMLWPSRRKKRREKEMTRDDRSSELLKKIVIDKMN